LESNPFAPPRTSDLDARLPASGPLALSPPSLAELERTGVWTRWLARLGILNIGVTVIALILKRVPGSVLSVLISAFVTGIYVVILRRQAAAAQRLRSEPQAAVAALIDAQASYFKTTGVLVILAMAFVVLGALMAGVAAVT
jgi:hypothetical protein